MSRSEYEEFWNSPEAKEFVSDVLTGMAPNMEDSHVVAHLVPDDKEGDVKFWVELGASIMLDKPIIALILEGRSVPGKLARIADRIVHLTGDGEVDAQRIEDAVQAVSPQ